MAGSADVIEDTLKQTLIDAGGEMYVPISDEMGTFRAVKVPMGTWYTDQFGSEWHDKFTSAATDCEILVDDQLAS